MSTVKLLEYSKKLNSLEIFFYFSTDEVYGEKIEGSCKESDRIEPTNPYSASKAAADQFIKSYSRTYGIKIIIDAYGSK